MDMPGGPAITVDAALFNRGSYDNCTPMSGLRFEIEPSQFDCENLGRNDIRFIVYDESGNSDWVYTYIIIQENMGMCPDSIGGIISGFVQREGGSLLTGVPVELVSSVNREVATDIYGRYKLNGLRRGESYYINPLKKSSLIEGVDARDLVLLRKYLAGENLMTSPYRLIAADVNNSGDITYTDYLQLRMMLLLNLESHPGMDSWRFVDKSIQFSDPKDPFKQPFSYGTLVDAHTKQTKRVDFVAVKVGDLDGLASESKLQGRNSDDLFILNTPDRFLTAGSVIEVPLYIANDKLVHAYQIEFISDTDKLQLMGVRHGDLFDKDVEIEWMTGENNEIRVVIDHLEPVAYRDGMKLINLKFLCLEDTRLSNSFMISNHQMKSLVFDDELTESLIALDFKLQHNGLVADRKEELLVSPNPFKDNAIIEFNTDTTGEAFIEMIGLDGKVLSIAKINTIEGKNTFILERLNDQIPGMYLLRVSNAQWNITGKIIVRD